MKISISQLTKSSVIELPIGSFFTYKVAGIMYGPFLKVALGDIDGNCACFDFKNNSLCKRDGILIVYENFGSLKVED